MHLIVLIMNYLEKIRPSIASDYKNLSQIHFIKKTDDLKEILFRGLTFQLSFFIAGNVHRSQFLTFLCKDGVG